ncbi:1154_t:CDS:2, partial [Gigaspora rosea]
MLMLLVQHLQRYLSIYEHQSTTRACEWKLQQATTLSDNTKYDVSNQQYQYTTTPRKGEEISAYPKDSHIFFKGTHKSWDYIIINESVYPPLHKLAYTKKPEQYAIPDQYIFDKYIVHSTKSPSDAAAKYCKGFKELKNKGTLSSEDIQEINANTINKNENKKKNIRMSG